MKERASGPLIAIIFVVFTLLIWEVIVNAKRLPIYILPAPSIIIQTLFNNIGMYREASFLTIFEAVAGLFIGTISGACTAALLGVWPRLEQGVMTLAILIKSTPMVAIAPLLTIWLGFGILPKVLITALLTFFPVLVNMLSGLKAVDASLLDTFASWKANRWEVFRHLRFPNSLPYLFTALKVSAPLSLIGAVIAEWTGASGGLGRTMWLAYTNLNLPFLFGAVFILAALGMSFYGIIDILEKRVIFWANK